MHPCVGKVGSAATAAGLFGYTAFSAIVNGFFAESTVCGIALLSVFAVAALTVCSYADTPDTRTCAKLMLSRGRSFLRGAFRSSRERPTRNVHPEQAA
jgi:hypothetical protein